MSTIHAAHSTIARSTSSSRTTDRQTTCTSAGHRVRGQARGQRIHTTASGSIPAATTINAAAHAPAHFPATSTTTTCRTDAASAHRGSNRASCENVSRRGGRCLSFPAHGSGADRRGAGNNGSGRDDASQQQHIAPAASTAATLGSGGIWSDVTSAEQKRRSARSRSPNTAGAWTAAGQHLRRGRCEEPGLRRQRSPSERSAAPVGAPTDGRAEDVRAVRRTP